MPVLYNETAQWVLVVRMDSTAGHTVGAQHSCLALVPPYSIHELRADSLRNVFAGPARRALSAETLQLVKLQCQLRAHIETAGVTERYLPLSQLREWFKLRTCAHTTVVQ